MLVLLLNLPKALFWKHHLGLEKEEKETVLIDTKDSTKQEPKHVQVEFEQDILRKNKVQIKCSDVL